MYNSIDPERGLDYFKAVYKGCEFDCREWAGLVIDVEMDKKGMIWFITDYGYSFPLSVSFPNTIVQNAYGLDYA